MFSLIFSVVLSAVVVASPAPTTQPATTQPLIATTQPINIVVPLQANKDQTLAEMLQNTELGKLAQGREHVTFDQVRNPLFWFNIMQELVLTLLNFIPRLFVAVLFLLFFWVIYRAVRRLVVGSMHKASVDPSIRDMLGHLIKWSIMGFGLVIACNQIGVQIAALLTGVGIIGLAVGFAAQETLANFIAGIVIFWDKPFKVGDWLELGETYGKVQRVTFRSTRILDLNGQLIVYPNTYMLSNRVANHTTHPLTRVAVPIGIAYGASIDTARKAMLDTVRGDDRISAEPPPHVVVEACSASSVDLLLRFWITDESLARAIVYEYIEKCKKALDAAKISIPYPHLQLLVEQTPAIDKLAGMRHAG